MNINKPLLTLALLAISPTLLAAAESSGEIIVSATRTAQSADESLAAVSVITRADIEASMASTLPELLQGVPGIEFSIAGGVGKDTALYLRGTNADHTVVLIDGVQVGSATTGQPNIQHLALDQIERIEVVRGTRSSLYGSEAIGGVVQIFTRQGSRDLQAHARLEAGTSNHQKLEAGLSHQLGSTRYQFNASHYSTDGINARPSKNPDLDGYLNDSLSLSSQSRLAAGELKLSLNQAQGRNWYDSTNIASDYYEEFLNQTLALRYQQQVSDSWTTVLALGNHSNASDNYTDSVLSGSYLTRRQSANWQNDLALSDSQLLSLGLDSKWEDIASTSTASFPVQTRGVNGAYLQDQLQLGRNQLNINARLDSYTDFGMQSTASLVAGRSLGAGWKGFVSYGTAFKAPTMNQLYSSVGNASLLPEQASSAELGLKQARGRQRFEFSLYQTDISNLIAYDSGSGLFQQTDQARITGAELSYARPLGQWRMKLGAGLLDPRDAISGLLLARRPGESYQLELSRKYGATTVDLNLQHRGMSYDNSSNTTVLAAYSLLNLRLDYRISKQLRLRFKGDNLSNEQYELRSGYSAPGASYYLGLDYRM